MIDSRAIDEVPNLVADLYRIVDRLEGLFHGRPFTVDGHLLGSIGEVLAAYHYGLDLTAPSTKGCDAQSAWVGGIEIKTTQRKSVAFRSEPPHLLVFQLDRTGRADEVFNGPGKLVWPFVGNRQKNGQSSITLSKLRELQRIVPPTERLPRVQRPGSNGAAVTQHCPVCSVAVEPNARYPLYVCRHCASRVTSADGRKLEFYSLSLSGGFGARYMDTGTEYGSHECFIEGGRCYADEARFGGIVIQTWS